MQRSSVLARNRRSTEIMSLTFSMKAFVTSALCENCIMSMNSILCRCCSLSLMTRNVYHLQHSFHNFVDACRNQPAHCHRRVAATGKLTSFPRSRQYSIERHG